MAEYKTKAFWEAVKEDYLAFWHFISLINRNELMPTITDLVLRGTYYKSPITGLYFVEIKSSLLQVYEMNRLGGASVASDYIYSEVEKQMVIFFVIPPKWIDESKLP